MVQSIDLNVFSGDFRCCSFHHVGCSLCDREKLRTPILGVYAQYLKMLMCGPGPTDGAMTFVVQMEQDKERLLPTEFYFVQEVDDMTTFTQVRELFGPLPEILEHRIKASWTKHNAHALRSTTAPTLELGRNPRGRSSVDEGAGVNNRNESSGLPQGCAGY